MIKGAQITAARALLGWTAKELAIRANVGTATLQRMESAGLNTVPGMMENAEKVRRALQEAGVNMTGTDDAISVSMNLSATRG